MTATAERVDKVAALHQQITEGVMDLMERGEWKRMLDFASRFHSYSFGNQMLIYVQRPDATRVAGFHTWKKLGRSVKKGEKGIAILAPVSYRATKKETEADDPKRDGRVRGFRGAYVFDVSQTEGDPLPEVTPLLEGEGVDGLWDALAVQVTGHGYTVEQGDCHPAQGWTRPSTMTVRIQEGMSGLMLVKTLMHELAHIQCGHIEEVEEYRQHRGRMEVEAESVAYIVAADQGLDTGSYSFGYVAGWSNGDPTLVRTTAETVTKAARTIIAGLTPVNAFDPEEES